MIVAIILTESALYQCGKYFIKEQYITVQYSIVHFSAIYSTNLFKRNDIIVYCNFLNTDRIFSWNTPKFSSCPVDAENGFKLDNLINMKEDMYIFVSRVRKKNTPIFVVKNWLSMQKIALKGSKLILFLFFQSIVNFSCLTMY